MLRKIKSLLFAFVLICNVACSQNEGQVFEGNWMLKEVGIDAIYECPDVIHFDKNGGYQILNDCYGDDGRNPVIEEGKWEYDSKRMMIVLSSRKFLIDEGNYVFKNNDEKLLASVMEMKSNMIILCFDEKYGECKEEKYERMVE